MSEIDRPIDEIKDEPLMDIDENTLLNVINRYQLVVPLDTENDLASFIQTEATKPNFNNDIDRPGSLVFTAQSALNTSYGSTYEDDKEALLDHSSLLYSKITEGGYVLKPKTLKLPNTSLKGAKASHQDAKLLLHAIKGDVITVPLYNSGFKITLKSPQLFELNNLYNRIGERFDTYGRNLGTLFYLYYDLQLKEIFINFILSLVIQTTLEVANRKQLMAILKDTIALNDYQVCLMYIASLMYPEGYHYRVMHKCGLNKSIKIDLKELVKTDFSRIPEGYIDHFTNDKASSIPVDKVIEYQRALNSGNTDYIDVDMYRFYLRVPILSQYTSYGIKYNDRLSNSIHDLANDEIVNEYIRHSFCSAFEPWILNVGVLNEGELLFTIDEHDRSNIVDCLHSLHAKNKHNEFSEKITKYINKSRLSFVAHEETNCPQCGEEVSSAVNGYVPIDVQTTFFYMLVMRLHVS